MLQDITLTLLNLDKNRSFDMATLILQDTYRLLEDEIKSLDKLRTETALKIQEAASHGDLKENYEYKAAKEAMELLMFKKELLQSHSPFQFIEFGEINTDSVEFGNKVTIHDESKNKTDDYILKILLETINPLLEEYKDVLNIKLEDMIKV